MASTTTYVPSSDDPRINGLLQGSQWLFGGSGAHVLTYSFNTSRVPGAGNWTAAQEAGVRAAFAAWSAVADIQFQEIKSGTYFYQSTADIALSVTGNIQQQSGFAGEAVFPNATYAQNVIPYLASDYAPGVSPFPYDVSQAMGDIFVDNKPLPGYLNPLGYFNLGGASMETLLHEIGHALGLKHSFDDGGNGKPTFAQLGIGDLDTDYNTVMSYTQEGQYIDWGNPSTPMPLDILAIQYLYGVNRNTNTGNNTYYFRDNGNVQTIWDAGGYDTLDASTLRSVNGITIDLRPGVISTFHEDGDYKSISAVAMSYTPTETQNGAVAPIDNLIERAIGSVSNDTIYGNDADNALLGGAGNDILQDATGNDTLDGGTGADQMVGGVGNDTYVVDNVGDRITEAVGGGTDLVKSSISINLTTGNFAGQELENITLTGTAAINAVGNALANTLIGNAGANQLNGGTGDDIMAGGAGNDVYWIDSTGDVATESISGAAGGVDLVQSYISYKLGANFENLSLLGTADLNGTGNDLANSISGTAGKNTLDGGAGADTLSGYLGDDTYIIDNLGDKVYEGVGGGTDILDASVSINLGAGAFLGQEIENVTLTGGAAINATGNALNNILIGNDGANQLDGGKGDDHLSGGVGDDTYVIDTLNDVVTEKAGEGIDTIRTSVALSAAVDNVENYTFTGVGAWTFQGSDGDNIIVSGAGNDTLDGGDGNDVLNGGAGADQMTGGRGDDTYIIDNIGDKVIEDANGGNDTVRSSIVLTALIGNVENYGYTGTANWNFAGDDQDNALTGGSGKDTLSGGLGNDTLDGGAGADKLAGGRGDDTYIVDNVGDTVTEAAGEGIDLIKSSITINLVAGAFIGQEIENVTLTGAAAINVTGNSIANILTGNGSANVIDGGAGADTMAGGLGNDTYIIDNAGDSITEDANAGIDTVKSSILLTATIANVENYTYTGASDWQFTGTDDANILTGGSGNDKLNGGAGADTLSGGLGNDIYVVDNAGDKVVEALNQGLDTITLAPTYNGSAFVLGANLENLDASQMTAAETLTGNAIVNAITGGSGNDTLDGGAGADTLAGGKGDDTYVIDNIGDAVVESAGEGTDTVKSSFLLASTIANVENYTYTGKLAWTFTGNDQDNVLTGGSGKDALSGGLGDDTLNGGAGADKLIGGQGNDIYIVDNAGDSVVEAAGEGTDLIKSSVSLNLAVGAFIGQEIENVTLTGAAAINVTGNALNNVLTGNDGANVIDGGTGADTLAGGLGNDTYVIDNASDTVTELFNAGIDTVKTSVAITTAIANVENYTYTGTGGWIFAGNALNNAITGSSGNDKLDGGAGADTLAGGLGNDTYIVDNTGDKVVEAVNQGIDTIILASTYSGSAFGYVLGANLENLNAGQMAVAVAATGNALVNAITGGDGNDTLNGGAGADRLIGGRGDDTYIFDNSGDKVIENAGEGNDTVRSSILLTSTFNNVENYTYAGALAWTFAGDDGDNALTGGNGKDTLSGGDGNDTLNGGAGADRLIGGRGDDTYIFDNVGDAVVEGAGEGIDLIKSSVSINLAAGTFIGQEIEYVTLTGAAALNVTGNALNNILTGNAAANILAGGDGDDVLDSGAGADAMSGGQGDDTYVVDSTGDKITELAGQGTDTILASVGINLNSGNFASQEMENVTLTGSAGINATGNALDNLLIGNDGANTIDGGAGADTMIGGLGDDTYIVDNAGDIVTESVNGGNDTLKTSVAINAAVANVENYVFIGAGDWIFTGSDAANKITGGGGNDILDGGLGADVMVGGLGNDTYYVDDVGDSVTELAGQGKDTIVATVSIDLTSTQFANQEIENITLSGGDPLNATGNTLNNIITGNGGNNILNGGTGTDTLIGGAGDDTYIVNDTSDRVVEDANGGTDLVIASLTINLASGNWSAQEIENVTLAAGAGVTPNGTLGLSLYGNALNNVLTGNEGANILDGGAGADTLIGGAGNDTYYLDNAGDLVIEAAGGGYDQIYSSVSLDMSTGAWASQQIEAVTLTGGGALDLTGNGLDNTLQGNSAANTLTGGDGNDLLDGGAGADTLIGGAGNDTYVVDNAGDVIVENSGGGNDTVKTSLAVFAAIANVENYTYIGAANWSFVGNGDANVITGGSGNDTLDGGAGGDTLIGGAGNDTYYVDSYLDQVVEAANGGIDTVWTSVTLTGATQYIENYCYTGALNWSFIGNGLANTLIGSSGNDNLYGGDGNDTISGGDGNDYLNGGAGIDVMTGGAGDDTYVVDNFSDVIHEDANQGNDTVVFDYGFSGLGYSIPGSIENFDYSRQTVNISCQGNDLNNVITGGSGNDTLNGGIGADTLIGGLGDDIYYLDNASDVVVENSGGGNDTVLTSLAISDPIANVENYTLLLGFSTPSYWTFTGTAQNNALTSAIAATLDGGDGDDTLLITGSVSTSSTLIGGAGNDSLRSMSYGNDTLEGGDGNDVLNGGSGADYLDGGSGIDTADYSDSSFGIHVSLAANAQNTGGNAQGDVLVNIENLKGSMANDILAGNSGNNIIDGTYGSDTMIGGSGYDTYKFAPQYSDHLTINNAGGTSPSGELDLGANATRESLWFSISGQDLVINCMQTNGSKITIQGWFSGDTSAQLSEIVLSDGSKIDSGLTSLVSAMATYRGQTPSFNPEGQFVVTMPTDTTLQNAIASAWHK